MAYYKNYKNRPAGNREPGDKGPWSQGPRWQQKGNPGSGTGNYYPKKPIKSFQDLEVYQITAGLAAVAAKKIMADQNPAQEKKASRGPESPERIIKDKITEKLLGFALAIPEQIARAHSLRFGHGRQCLDDLEKALLWCNLAAVYLEQYRDIVNVAIEHDFFDDCIKKYLAVRGRILRLERSWEKFIELNREQKS